MRDAWSIASSWQLIEEVTTQSRSSEWLQRLEQAGIPCGPINNYAQVFSDPQVLAQEMAVEVDHPALGRLHALGTPIKMSHTPLNPRRRAPLLGEHTDAVLRAAGVDAAELEELRASGAIR